MFDREVFWEVVDLWELDDEELKKYWNLKKEWNDIVIRDEFILERWKIYSFSWWNIYIWSKSKNEKIRDLILKWSSARLDIKWNLFINWNIFYWTSYSENYLDIPNLRIDVKWEIKVDSEVEYIESQMTAQVFKSWKWHNQLKILWDVIAETTYLQREPSLVNWSIDIDLNPPSELIIEDYRKFIIPAPWDTILRDSHSIWQQVNPINWENYDPY